MNNPDYDENYCNKDEYGNVTAKNQEGIKISDICPICGGNLKSINKDWKRCIDCKCQFNFMGD